MSSAAQAVLASWSFPPFLTALNVLTALLYIRGWIPLHEAMPSRFTPWRLACFLSGVAILQIALASPIDTFDHFLLASHMLQHMLLVMVIPPLLLLGDPAIPLLKGLPNWIARDVLGPFLTSPALAHLGHRLTHPVVGLSLRTAAMRGWHVPALYELALRSPGWHEVEHACFLATSLLFWWPVIQPWPSRPHWSRWAIILYLLLGEFVNSVPSAFLAFSERVLYRSYLAVPRLAGISAQNDQVAAGAFMWVIGSFAFLIPAALLTVGLLSPEPAASSRESKPTRLDFRVRRYPLLLTFALPLAIAIYGWLAPKAVDADGAVVRLQGVAGPFLASVFTSPTLHAGASDVSVLVQDRDSGKIILDAAVDFDAKPTVGTVAVTRARAERQQSTNKLLEAATLNLASPGPWELDVSILRGSDEGSLSKQLNVEPSNTQNTAVWLYPLLGSIVIALVVFHRVLGANALHRGERESQYP